jgi:hypothetical protein
MELLDGIKRESRRDIYLFCVALHPIFNPLDVLNFTQNNPDQIYGCRCEMGRFVIKYNNGECIAWHHGFVFVTKTRTSKK